MKRVKLYLQQDYPKLGFVGDEVEVRGGYARNYLIPRGIAFEASDTQKRFLKHRLMAVTAKKIKLRSEAENVVKEMEGMVPEFTLRFGEGGKSFGSISNRDIAKWLDDKGYKLDRTQIVIPEPIKKSGEHQVKVKLHSEIIATLKVRVSAEALAVAPVTADAGLKPARRGRGKSRKASDEGQSEAAENQE